MSLSVTSRLFQLLCQTRKLTELTLQKTQMNSQIVGLLVEMIEDNNGLKILDISWTQLDHSQFKPILECLASNRSLVDVNLSWNRLADLPTAKKTSETIRLEQIKAATDIASFMKYNKQLANLDLSHCNLSSPMFEIIKPCLRKSMTLLTIDLSGNPFINHNLDLHAVQQAIVAKPVESAKLAPKIRGYTDLITPKNR